MAHRDDNVLIDAGPGCAACKEQRPHTDKEWENHPFHRHGYVKESGYSHPRFDPTHPEYIPPTTRKEPEK
jgi:hypothetical protein